MTPSSHRLRRFAAFAPSVLGAWALVVGLPLAPGAEGSAGHLDTEQFVLTGAKAPAFAPASEPAPDHGHPEADADIDAAVPATASAPAGDGAEASTTTTTTAATVAPEPRATRGRAAGGWSASVDLDDGTQMVGLSWAGDDAADGAVLAVRAQDGDEWSPWEELSVEADEGPDDEGNGRVGPGPVWLGSDGVERVEVAVVDGSVADLSMLAMKWTDPVAPRGATAGAEPAGPGIRPRSDWARAGWATWNSGCGSTPEVMPQLRFAVVHHTASSNDYTASQVPGIIEGIRRFEVDDLGYCDLAYNFVIDRFGTVWQGRSGDVATPVRGGHAKGFNSDSMGIAMLGQYHPAASPPAATLGTAARTSLQSLLAWKFSIHGIDPTATVRVRSAGSTKYPPGVTVTLPTISGHRDSGATACPGDEVYTDLSAVRTSVAAIIDGSRDPARWSPFPDPRNLTGLQWADFLGRTASNTDRAYWASRMQRDGLAPAGVIRFLVDSAEHRTRSEPVVRLYLAYFGRVPDTAGLTYWLDEYRSGRKGLNRVANLFAGSGEFRRTYGDLGDTDFVKLVYRNVLDREPDQEGLDYWRGELASRTRTRGEVMVGFSESAEYRNASSAHVDVILTHHAMLRRAISVTSYFKWVVAIRNGDASITTLAGQILRSAEYRQRVQG